MGRYGVISEANGICLHSIHLVAIDNTGAGEWEHHMGFKQQGEDSTSYCALEMQHGVTESLSSLTFPSSHVPELPAATTQVAIGHVRQSKLPPWIGATQMNSLTVLEITVYNQDVGSAVFPLDSSETVCFHDNASVEATYMAFLCGPFSITNLNNVTYCS